MTFTNGYMFLTDFLFSETETEGEAGSHIDVTL